MKKTIMRDPLISRVLNAGPETYVVGGYIRDILLGTRSRDIDFVVRGDVRAFAAHLFPEKEVRVIGFRDDMLVRIVIGDMILDFSELKGTLEDDLLRRDFTMNAIAWSPQSGLIDVTGGVDDIAMNVIEAVQEKNFIEDPLRLLRAYRFSGELGWRIDIKTRHSTRKLKHRVRSSATERITLELLMLLDSKFFLKALRSAFQDGLLMEILAIDNRQLAHNIKGLSRFEAFLNTLPEDESPSFGEIVSQGLTYRGLLRAEQLLCRAELEASALALSRAIAKRIRSVSGALSGLEKKMRVHKNELFELFTEAGEGTMDFALLARRRRFIREARKFLNLKPLLGGDRIMQTTGLGPEPELGEVLKEMTRLQYLGKIRDVKGALAWLSRNYLKQ